MPGRRLALVRSAGLIRPRPPASLSPDQPAAFVPAPEISDWIRRAILSPSGSLFNDEHEHLTGAEIGCLWTSEPHTRQQRTVVGMAEIPVLRGNRWAKGRHDQQLREWFGFFPDFLLTFAADHASQRDDASWCALVEHELFHCAQAVDRFGGPKFHDDGRPVYAIKGHDCEEFVGVVRRYGAGAAAGGVADLVKAARRRPEIAAARILGACGTCESLAA